MNEAPSLTTYFTDIRLVICREIHQAEREIIAAIAWFTDAIIWQELLYAIEKSKIRVEIIIMDDEINGASGVDFRALEESGIAVYFYPELKELMMHHKFCLIDNHILLLGSYNWTRKATKNEENLLKICVNEQEAIKFQKEFQRLKELCHRKYRGESKTLSDEQLKHLQKEQEGLTVKTLCLKYDAARIRRNKNGYGIDFLNEQGSFLFLVLWQGKMPQSDNDLLNWCRKVLNEKVIGSGPFEIFKPYHLIEY